LIAAIGCLVVAGLAVGCSSGGPDSATAKGEGGRRVSAAGLSFTIPAGWHRVPLSALPGARVPLEIASFEPRGAVQTICDPRQIIGQIPAGGALVQLLANAGTAISREQPGEYRRLRKPFHLGSLQSQECGETTSFRLGGRVYGLRIWAGPAGARPAVRDDVERLIDSLAVHAATEDGLARPRLAITYGPYLGVRCRKANSIRCDRVGIDVVLRRRALEVSAELGGRTVTLQTPGLHNGVRGKDWVGTLPRTGMTCEGSAFFIPAAGRDDGTWVGDPSVQVPVRLIATYADGGRGEVLLRRVPLRPGWG
jgi:hypothetical protein